ncbi:MAG: YHS domain-containing (seleno)protein [Planctomycetota bacterium]
MTRKRTLALLAITATVAIGYASRAAQSPTTDLPTVQTDDDGVAIHGYDPVAYFTEGRPTAGSTQHQLQWNGATYRFATAENRTAFQQDPERYAPQYGGYCAWGLAAKGQLFDIDPTAWQIVDDKLYLNYNAEIQRTWLGDIAGFVRSADQKWTELTTTTTK